MEYAETLMARGVWHFKSYNVGLNCVELLCVPH